MATVIPVPSLSTKGFVTDPNTKIDLLLSHWFLADYNQSYLYAGTITSLPQMMQKYGADAEPTIVELKRKLYEYLSSYYVTANVEVTSLTDLKVGGKVELKVAIGVYDGSTNNDFNKVLNFKDSKFLNIVSINNG